jgi:hypothetical protein
MQLRVGADHLLFTGMELGADFEANVAAEAPHTLLSRTAFGANLLSRTFEVCFMRGCCP